MQPGEIKQYAFCVLFSFAYPWIVKLDKLRLCSSHMRNDDFECDDAKAAANLARHGVALDVACEVFDDPRAVHRDDDRMNYGEDRCLTVGEAGHRLLAVVWTTRGDRVRIISARPPTAEERRAYREQ